MKKLALSSLIAVFAVAGNANAADWFVGGSVGMTTAKDTGTEYWIAPELGYHLNEKWDVGANVGFAKDTVEINGFEINRRDLEVAAFARYNVAQFGDVKLLLKGTAGADFTVLSTDGDSETATVLSASVIPMIAYDISDRFTLFANLNFVGVYGSVGLKNENLGIDNSWAFGFGANSDNVANTSDFQIGFNYNF